MLSLLKRVREEKTYKKEGKERKKQTDNKDDDIHK